MPESKIKIGIAGCGAISSTHADAINSVQEGTLVAAHSRSRDKLNSFTDRYKITGFTDYQDFLTHPGLDAITICTPTGTHLDYGKAAAEAGKHVIVEKPIEITTERGQSLIKACANNGVRLAVIYQNRFIDDVVQLKRLIDQSELGKPVMVRASVKWFRNDQYYRSDDWRATYALDGGGVVVNQAIHTLDLLQWIMGDISSLYAYSATLTHDMIEAEDNAVATFQFKNGCIGTFEASTSIVPARARKIEINCANGTALLTGDELKILRKDDNPEPDQEADISTDTSNPSSSLEKGPFRKQYSQIIKALLADTKPEVSGPESLKSLALVKAIYTSAELRKEVVPEYMSSTAV